MSVCPVCGRSGRAILFDKDGYRYASCPGCGSASLDPMPDETAAPDLYDLGYFTGGVAGAYGDYGRDEPLHRANARMRLRVLERAGLTPPGRLVDVGSAFGFFLDEARSAGWDVIGVDVSAAARATAAERFDLESVAGLDDLEASTTVPVDVVTFFQSLEHMVDPRGALARARAHLAPGGGTVIETWDRSSAVARLFGKHWHQVTPPSVVHLFDRRSLAALLTGAGFSVETMRVSTKYVSLGAAAHLVVEKYPRSRRVLAPMTGGPGERIRVRYGFGDLITVVARPT